MRDIKTMLIMKFTIFNVWMYFGIYKIMSLHLKSLDVEKNKQILRDKLEEFKTILKSLQTTLQIHN